MLKQINIQNFAIIDNMNIDFDDGLTVITGQTGAGKSIVIDAIEQLLGHRASSAMVSTNKDYAFIEGIFETNSQLTSFLSNHDFVIEDEYIIISKKIKKDGKSQIKLNNRIVTNDLIKNIAVYLLEIHSQSANYEINDQSIQQQLLDSFFSESEKQKLHSYQEQYHEYNKLKNELSVLTTSTIDPELLSFYQDQLNEINNSFIDEDLVDDLQEKEKYYQDYEKIHQTLDNANQILNYSNIIENLSDLNNNLDKLSDINDEYQQLANKSNEIYYSILDLKQDVYHQNSSLSFDEEEYQIIKEQLFNYQKLLKKYSYSRNEVEEKIIELNQKIDFINNSDDLVMKLENKIKKAETDLTDKAKELDEIRSKYIKLIEQEVIKHLADLYLNESKFKIDLEKTPLSINGQSKAIFLFSANKGSSLKPLSQVASGGELSRFMLALKIVSLNRNKVYIFDEIDTGVSGQVANAIGKKIKEISKSSNIICITHLPQVAAFSDNHLYIEKNSTKHVTTSNCHFLNQEEKEKEIAKMLSGDKITDAALAQAKELINDATI